MKKTKPTLLEKIASIPAFTVEPDPDVAIAWIKGEIKQSQIIKGIWGANSISSNTTNAYSFINRSILKAYQEGRIKIVD